MGLISLKDIGTIFKDIREAITGEAIKDPNKEAEILMKLKEAELLTQQLQAKVIEAEAKSEHFLTSTWRPITMLVFVFIIANNYIIYPYLSLFFSKAPILKIPPDMWELLKIGLGGYVVGRSVEKALKFYKG